MITYYNKYLFDSETNLNKIDDIISNINNIVYKFNIDNNNYNIFKLYSTFYCIESECNNFNCLNGYCYKHFSNKNIEAYINLCKNELKNNYKEIKKIENKYRIYFAEQIKYYYKINRLYLIYLYTNCNFNKQKEYIFHNKQYINNKCINYECINVKFDKNIINKIKIYLENNDINIIERKINVYIMIKQIHKKFQNYQIRLSNLIYNINQLIN